MSRSSLAAVACLALLSGCRVEQTFVPLEPHLERMLEQEKVVPYAEVPFLPNRTAMQAPPDGTLPVDAFVGDPRVATGVDGERWVARIPVPIDRPRVQEGRARFDVFCATCHGVLGDGVSAVASKMALRKPQSLLDDRIRAMPVGHIFRTIREGYGLMPPYSVQLSVQESWAVVAYVRALQLAGGVYVSRLPPGMRAELAKEAR